MALSEIVNKDQNKPDIEEENCIQMEERGTEVNLVEMGEIGEMDEDCAKMEQEEIGDMEKGGGKNGIINTAASKIRKRCGSCPGCLLDESCGICGPCLRKQRAEIIAQRPHEICKERKCHVLKKEKSQRCGECAGCQSLPCGICVFCCGQNQNLCKTKRCCNRTWIKMIPKTITHEKMYFGLGIKIKPKSKSNKPKEIEINEDFVIFEDEFSDLAVQNDQLNEMPIESSAGDLTDSKKGMINDLETQQKSKQRSSKSVKRSKKCGKCSDCQAEDCGNCRGCQINREYSEDKLILGKVPCLGNRCNFPEDLTGDMDAITLMKQQDDSSNGTVCPVKVVNGILYDFRCYFCKKLPRVGSANRSELMRHYSIHHFADQLKEEFSINMHQGHCSLCDLNLKGKNIPSHFGQKHNEVVRYLPLEAAALCPEDIKEGKRNVPHHPALAVSQKKNTPGSLDSQQLSSDYDPSSVNGDSLYEDKEELIKKDDVVEGWIIENGNSKPSRNENKVETLAFLKPNPKTIKDFQKNEKILADFSKDHSDDMFDAPNYVSQMSLLENSFSDQDSTPGTSPSTPGNAPKTPVTDFVSRFDGWSVETPIHLRQEEEEEIRTLGQFNHCAFLRRAINQKMKPKKLSQTFPDASAQSSSKSFSSCLTQIKPALEKIASSLQSESEDEMEDYFEDSEGQT